MLMVFPYDAKMRQKSGNISDCSACVWLFYLSVTCETFFTLCAKESKTVLLYRERVLCFVFLAWLVMWSMSRTENIQPVHHTLNSITYFQSHQHLNVLFIALATVQVRDNNLLIHNIGN